MSATLRITTLVEDGPATPPLMAEHGAAYWLSLGKRALLFDTGQGAALTPNAEALGIPLSHADAVVLSHGHYDHTGGLEACLDAHLAVYAHPEALQPKYARNSDGSARYIGMNDAFRAALSGSEFFRPVTKPTEIIPGVFVTGPVPRVTGFEDTGGPFFTDESCTTPDPLTDDQSLFIPTREGTVVLIGCAHAGVINTLEYVLTLTEAQPLAAVIGGMHLISASDDRITATAQSLKGLGVPVLAPCHCTGQTATDHFAQTFGGALKPCHPGSVFEFRLP